MFNRQNITRKEAVVLKMDSFEGFLRLKSMKLVLFFLFVVTIMFNPFIGMKADAARCELPDQVFGIPTWYKYLSGDNTFDAPGKCTPQIESSSDALPIGLAIFDIALRLAGIVAVFMVFYGGFKYVLTQGEPDKAAGARKTVMNALIGLVIVIISSSVVAFIGNRLVTVI